MNQLHALGLTLACELPLMALITRPLPILRVLAIATSASCLTHPVAWHIASILSPSEYPIGFWLIEIGVFMVEAVWYWLWLHEGMYKSLWWSLLANFSSLIVGFVLLRS